MTENFITIETMKPLLRGTKGMGTQSPDSTYIANGHYPLVDNAPSLDEATQTITFIDIKDEINKVVNRVYTVVDIPLEEHKDKKLQELKRVMVTKRDRPRVDTGLGYFVDGGRENKDDFFSKWESMSDIDTTTVKDADNNFHPDTSKSDMQVIYRAIVANGEALLTWKWTKEQEIQACTTYEQIKGVEL